MAREIHRGPSTLYRVATFPVEVAKLPFRAFGAGLRETLEWIETRPPGGLLPRIQLWFAVHGLSPQVGSLGDHSGIGGGFTIEVPDFPARRVSAEISGAITNKLYMEHSVGLRWQPAAPVVVYGGARFDRNTRDEFYGIGDDVPRSLRSDYQRKEWGAVTSVLVTPAAGLAIRVGADWLSTEVDPGRNEDIPDTHDLFSADSLAGLVGVQRFVRPFAEVRWEGREPSGDPLAGGWAALRYAFYGGTGETPFDFHKIYAEARGYLPLGGLRRVLALRAMTELTRPSDKGIPFYALSRLGGGSTLRGFRAGRFHARDAVLLSAEYRYRVWREHRGRGGLDMVLFLDEGTVIQRFPADVSDARFHEDWGIGLQAAVRDVALVRLELARSDEETLVRIQLGARF
ncbi:MAG: BamA/TamA family outer membrane protein [Gemmatimonadetes bacterium]|nr:BamA/TamA family outer membrane protein [Gemmatimonadota bacterium]